MSQIDDPVVEQLVMHAVETAGCKNFSVRQGAKDKHRGNIYFDQDVIREVEARIGKEVTAVAPWPNIVLSEMLKQPDNHRFIRGAVLHEIGHFFSLQHEDSGIMGPALDATDEDVKKFTDTLAELGFCQK